ncbi:hypothetical protein [Variovorax beijingensis]|uniref:hypothetical protein n=1 Tax=Variovorax beijingensis TaxID=2496117 RepID=UPI0037DCBA7D
MALLVAAQPEAYCAREPQARLQRERNEPQLPDALVPALGQLEHAHADEQRGQHQECAVGAGQHFDHRVVDAARSGTGSPSSVASARAPSASFMRGQPSSSCVVARQLFGRTWISGSLSS